MGPAPNNTTATTASESWLLVIVDSNPLVGG
jgi:hypothetical protein